MSIRDHFAGKELEKPPATPVGDYLFAPYWSGLIDARLTERDLQGGVRAMHQFLQQGYRPIDRHMHVLFLIALNEHSEHLLPFARVINQDHDAIIRDAIFCLHGILSRLKRPISLASCLPRWHPESILPASSAQPRANGVFAGADALLKRCEGIYRGSIWGLIVSGNTNHDYEITEGSWNLLEWLVEVWRRDSEDEQSKVGSGISTMLASQLDPDATLFYPMIVLERAFFAQGKLASTAKMTIGRDLFYMLVALTDLRPSPFRIGAQEIAEKMSQIIDRNVSCEEETLETLEAILPRKTSSRIAVIESIKEHLAEMRGNR